MTQTIEMRTEGMSIKDVNNHLIYFQENKAKVRYLDRILSKRKLLSPRTKDSVYNLIFNLMNNRDLNYIPTDYQREEIKCWKEAGTVRRAAELSKKPRFAADWYEKLGETEKAKEMYKEIAEDLGNVGLLRKIKMIISFRSGTRDFNDNDNENAASYFMKAGEYEMAARFYKRAQNRIGLVEAYEKAGKTTLARQICEEIARSSDGYWETDPMALEYYERAGNVTKTIELQKRIRGNK